MNLSPIELEKITSLLHEGKIIACPTEGVFGLSCDPFHQKAVQTLLHLKKRPVEKGLILIIDNWDRIRPYIEDLNETIWEKLKSSTETPTTWILPANKKIPYWICGNHDTIAIRLIQHPIAQAICTAFEGPLVSTSANLSNQNPYLNYQEVEQQFGNQIDYIVKEETQGLNRPSQIIEALSGKVLRS